jgi:hypothetical protein
MTGIISASLTLFSIQVGFPVAGILVGDYFLKSQKDKKVRYALGISAFAFGGWLLSNHITTKYLEDVEITLEAEGEDVVLDWFDTNLVGRTSYDVKDNDARIIMLDYALPVREIEGLFSESNFVSTYPEQQAKPIVYEPMMKEGLEDIEFELDELFKMSDGHYFVSRNVPNTNRSEKSELIFFTMSGDGRKRPLRIFQLATTMY